MSDAGVWVVARVLVAALIGGGGAAAAQSTSATLFGVVVDEQRAVLRGAAITLTNLDTGAKREATSDQVGTFRLAGLPPGRYELRLTRDGFAPAVRTPITLTLGEERTLETVLKIASVHQSVSVDASRIAGIEPTKTVLGRTFTTRDVDALPVPARDFSTLATLTPGVLPDLNQGGGSAPNLTGFATAAQTGRNNAILIDGLSHDDALPGAMRGIVSLEAVKEFVVSTNGVAAEHGQASGAVVNVATRSGTNAFAMRGFYYHRDDRWDATPGSAKLAVPPVDKARLDQKIVGGSAGGPMVRNRAFFFASLEHLLRETDHIVTSSKLPLFRPDDEAALPQHTRNPNVLGRVDINHARGGGLMVRYRFDDSTSTNRFTEADLRLGTAERAHDLFRRDQDLGLVDTRLLGGRGVNEMRVLFGRRFVDLNVDAHCPDCPAENRPSIRLGKSFNLPQKRTQDRWQFADTLTWLLNRGGQHTVKAGVDVSWIRDANYFPLNFAGTYTFTHDLLFDALNADTYPSQFTNSTGRPEVDLKDRMSAAFVQDQWRPSSRLTFNAGLRWDHENGPGVSHDRNNFAPRVGISYDLTGTATTVVRGSYGHYYDQVFLLVAREVVQAAALEQARIDNPGYPDDPRGPNPRRTDTRPLIPSTTRYGEAMRTPLAAEATLGLQRELGAKTVLTVDGVWARGRHLLAGHDLNYPDLSDPVLRPRPNPNFLVIQAYETRGNSWYSGLQAALKRQYANGYSYFVAYTLSSSERDTEDFRFAPQDQRDYAADRGPGANDSRHRLAANVTADLPFALRAAAVVTARTSLPYNVTTGVDNNRDTYFTDRPPGIGRNSGRGDPFWQTDVRVSRSFRLQRVRLEVLGEVFNVTNRRNWIGHLGDLRSAQFGKPTASTGAREIQLGVRVEY